MPSISLAPPELPSTSALLATVRESCVAASSSAHVEVDESKLESVIAEFHASPAASQHATARDYSLAMPLRWDSVAQEVNFIALTVLLSSLSPLEHHLRQLPGSPSPESIPRHLLIGLYLSAPPSNHLSAPSPLSAAHIADLGDGEVADILGLKIHQEKRVEHIPVATIAERGGPGSAVVSHLRASLNRVGKRLVENRYVDLGAFVLETLNQCKTFSAASQDEESVVGYFVHRLVSFLPDDFNDAYTISGGGDRPVHIYKNALTMLAFLSLQIGNKLPWSPSSQPFPLIADGILPRRLLQRSILTVSPSSSRPDLVRLQASMTDSTSNNNNDDDEPGTPTSKSIPLVPESAHLLRAATVALSTRIQTRLNEAHLKALDLDAYLRRTWREREKETTTTTTTGSGETKKKEDQDEDRGMVVEQKMIEVAGMW